MQHKLSIVTICYNSEKEIKDTLQSIAEQEYTDYEIVIKDGASTDNTMSIVNDFIKENPAVDVTAESAADKGIYNAMNAAIDMADGEWIFFLNSGDRFISKDVLTKVSESLNDENEVVYGNVIMSDGNGDSRWKGDISLIEKKMPFGHQSCFMKTSMVRRYKFDEQFKIAADYNMVLRSYKDGRKFYYVDTDIARFDMDGVSSTVFCETMRERYAVRSSNNVLGPDYKKSFAYKKDMFVAKIKEFIAKHLSGKLLTGLREIYKSKIKKYQKV